MRWVAAKARYTPSDDAKNTKDAIVAWIATLPRTVEELQVLAAASSVADVTEYDMRGTRTCSHTQGTVASGSSPLDVDGMEIK